MNIDTQLLEQIAEKIHEKWMEKRMSEGWTYGAERDDQKKETPCLVPYHALPEIEKEYDRATALQTMECLQELGYELVKKG